MLVRGDDNNVEGNATGLDSGHDSGLDLGDTDRWGMVGILAHWCDLRLCRSTDGETPILQEALDATPTTLATPTAVRGVQAADARALVPHSNETLLPQQGVDGDRDRAKADRQDSLRDTVCSYPWPQGCDYWIGIAQCESTLGQNPRAYEGNYIGLFQIWMGHGYDREWLKDDKNNVQAAWEISHEGTYTGAWPYCQWQ